MLKLNINGAVPAEVEDKPATLVMDPVLTLEAMFSAEQELAISINDDEQLDSQLGLIRGLRKNFDAKSLSFDSIELLVGKEDATSICSADFDKLIATLEATDITPEVETPVPAESGSAKPDVDEPLDQDTSGAEVDIDKDEVDTTVDGDGATIGGGVVSNENAGAALVAGAAIGSLVLSVGVTGSLYAVYKACSFLSTVLENALRRSNALKTQGLYDAWKAKDKETKEEVFAKKVRLNFFAKDKYTELMKVATSLHGVIAKFDISKPEVFFEQDLQAAFNDSAYRGLLQKQEGFLASLGQWFSSHMPYLSDNASLSSAGWAVGDIDGLAKDNKLIHQLESIKRQGALDKADIEKKVKAYLEGNKYKDLDDAGMNELKAKAKANERIMKRAILMYGKVCDRLLKTQYKVIKTAAEA